MNYTSKHIRQHNLANLITESGLSKGQFALQVGTAPAYLSQLLNVEQPRGMGDALARKIEAAFAKPMGWMDIMPAQFETQPVWYADPLAATAQTTVDNDIAELIFLQEVELAGGGGRTSVLANPQHSLGFAKSMLRRLGVAAQAAYCVSIVGNSMEPAMPDGATLGIDSGNTQIMDGDIYALDHAGSLRVRQLYHIPGGGLRLRSFNHREWPDEHLAAQDAKDCLVLGRVFWWSVLR